MAELTPLVQMTDFSSAQTGNSFLTKYANRNSVSGASLNPWHGVKHSSLDNTQIAGLLAYILPTLQKEMVQIDPKFEPLTTRVAPFVRIDDLNIVKNARRLVRGDIPIVPHRGALTIAETEEITRHRRQVRRGKEVEIELTSLFTQKGLNTLDAIIRGLTQSLLDSHMSNIMLELATASGREAIENAERGNNPLLNAAYTHGDAQKNALLEYLQVRTESFAALAKPGPLRFDLLVQKAREHVENENGVPDTLVCGPGTKVRISLQDPTMVFYYAVGPGKQWMREEGIDRIKSFQGLAIVEASGLNPNSSARSRATRTVEVGEFYRIGSADGACSSAPNFHPRQRNIQIYDEGRDRLHELCLTDAVKNCISFDTSTGELVRELYELAEEINTGNTAYMRDNGLALAKAPKAYQYSPFLFEDNDGRAHVARFFGQMDQAEPDRDQNIAKMAIGSFEALITDATSRATIAAGLETGVALLTRISEETYDPEHWTSIKRANGEGELMRFHRNELNQLADAKGNQFGSLNYGDVGDDRIPRGQGFGNGAGMRELASKYRRGGAFMGDGTIFAEAYTFMSAVDRLVGVLRLALPDAHTLNPKTASAAWFHAATAATTFVDGVYAGFELPVWMEAAEVDQRAIGTVDLAEVGGDIRNAEGVTQLLSSIESALRQPDTPGDHRGQAREILNELALLAINTEELTAFADRALSLLHRIVARSDVSSEITATGLGQIDLRMGAALLLLGETTFDPNPRDAGNAIGEGDLSNALMAVISYMLGMENNDISPAAFRAIGGDQAKSLKMMRTVMAYFYRQRGDRDTMHQLIDLAANLEQVTTWWAATKKKAARPKPDSVLNDIDIQAEIIDDTNDFVAGGQGNQVRTPLTASHNILEGLIRNGFGVSDPHSPWSMLDAGRLDVVARTPFGASGAAAIGTSLDAHPYWFNKQQPGATGSGGGTDGSEVMKRSREFSAGGDFGGGGGKRRMQRMQRATHERGVSMQIESLLGDTGDVYDFGAGVGGAARFGTQWPSMAGAEAEAEERERMDIEEGFAAAAPLPQIADEPLGRTAYYRRHTSLSFRENYASAKTLGAVGRGLAVTILFTPINRVNAATLARRMYAPFDALFMRPHITHVMMSAWVIQAGPETFINAYTETDTRWGIDTEAKILKFALTYQSAAFLHNPQFTFPLLDVAPARNAYKGGNGTEFFKLGSAEYDLRTQSASKSIYAVLIPMGAVVPEPIDLTGCYHMNQYDNNDEAAVVPHYAGAPLLSKMWGFQNLVVKRTRETGFDDQLRNSLMLPGMQRNVGPSNSGSAGDFTVLSKNQGHWGPTFAGVKQFRNGSALVPRPTSTQQTLH